jgi:hypothetical protein
VLGKDPTAWRRRRPAPAPRAEEIKYLALPVLSLGLLGDALRDAATGERTGRTAQRLTVRQSPAASRSGPAESQAAPGTGPAAPGPAPRLAVRDLRITTPGADSGTVLVSGLSFDLLPARLGTRHTRRPADGVPSAARTR